MTDRYESRATTHAADCWSWGPKHYECAVGQIKRDKALLRQALEALEFEADGWEYPPPKTTAAIGALRERLGKGG